MQHGSGNQTPGNQIGPTQQQHTHAAAAAAAATHATAAAVNGAANGGLVPSAAAEVDVAIAAKEAPASRIMGGTETYGPTAHPHPRHAHHPPQHHHPHHHHHQQQQQYSTLVLFRSLHTSVNCRSAN